MSQADLENGNTRVATLNAKVAAVALLLGAAALHWSNQLEYALLPIRILIVGVLIMGAWAFSDEMGLRKPLNRAAFICFLFSMLAFSVALLNPQIIDLGKYYLIYAFMLLLAVLIWSAAFLHRQRNLKVVGALGAVAAALPIIVLIAGHVSVGAAAYFGVRGLFDPDAGSSALGTTPINFIEAIFLMWATAAAVMLFKGNMSPSRYQSNERH